MQIITLKQFAPTSDHPLWWLVSPPYFESDVLSCAVPAYADFSGIPKELRDASAANRRYSIFLQELDKMLKRRYNASVKRVYGQPRFAIAGPNDSLVELAIRSGHPCPEGFETSECGVAMQNLSQLAFESMEFVDGVPSNLGALLVHRECPTERGSVEIFFAYEWSATQGSDLVSCETSARMGPMRFEGYQPIDRRTTGDDVDL